MGSKDGFLRYNRELPQSRDPEKRIEDFKEIDKAFPIDKTREQAARCMDCGVPFCHKGCPLGNVIPEFNDAVYQGKWEEAIRILSETNNFPEFTGRICPAPCEASCVLGINKPPVTIEHIEKTIAEKAFEQDYIKPNPPESRTGKRVAIIGSGPAGLSAAAQLNQAGHWVTVYEREDKPGGLLRYGIPDFKLEKWVIDRRLEILEKEGIRFKVNSEVGKNVDPQALKSEYDALLICTGATLPRELPIKGRDLEGIHTAMDFLKDQNKWVSEGEPERIAISAHDKAVVVIGGGDTGSDCVGTSHRQGAKSVLQLELMEKPHDHRTDNDPWPQWPMTLRTSSSHEEGGERTWSVLTKEFIGNEKGQVEKIKLVDIEWVEEGGRKQFREIAGSDREIPCELALLAVGFSGPETGLLNQLNVSVNSRHCVETHKYQTSELGVFSAGDARRGQSLVVWAQAEGREAAVAIDKYLMGTTSLQTNDNSFLAINK